MNLTQLRAVWSAAALLSILSAAAALLLTGCGRSDTDRTRDVADRFLTAMNHRDWDAARPLLTAKAQERMEGSNPFGNDAGATPDATPAPEIGEPQIDGDSATVPATVGQDDKRTHVAVRLRREQNEWRVYAVRIDGGPTGNITLDFEHPETVITDTFRALGQGIGAMMKGVGEGLGAMMKGIGEGVSAMDKATTASPSPSPTPSSDVQIEEKSSSNR